MKYKDGFQSLIYVLELIYYILAIIILLSTLFSFIPPFISLSQGLESLLPWTLLVVGQG